MATACDHCDSRTGAKRVKIGVRTLTPTLLGPVFNQVDTDDGAPLDLCGACIKRVSRRLKDVRNPPRQEP